ncbi:hypothetical protein CNBG_4900 [Cryptococcus deuterogattii R265]|uniref:uncharacterized protein n=1 Tax=Cryptococcus deuterogattii (strain R265) TaxID=294750 RepID=UPI001938A5D2|nr:hypothetical protein CNBG_4900 [Cryptococcus deuterogattii R265]
MHDVKRLIHPAQTIHNLASTSLLHGTMALPYDATPPPEDTLPPAPAPAPRLEALDLPLDDCPRGPHVQSLMSRMSSSKVYLVDESPAILHLDGHARLREPAVRRLVKQLDSLGDDGLQSWLDGLARESGVGVKGNALYLSSELIQHLSTSKIFSWATGLGAQPMGIEWINDTTLHILFPSPRLSVLALALLAKTGFSLPPQQDTDQEQETYEQGDDPLQERSAHPFPLSLLPRKPVAPIEGGSLGDQGGETEVTKRGRGQFTLPHSPRTHGNDNDNDDLLDTIEDGVNPLARIALRLALVDDMTVRQRGKESEGEGGSGEEGDGDGRAGGQELAKRLGRERRKPYDRPARSLPSSGRERGLVTQEELDRELESLRSGTAHPRAEGEMDIDDDDDGSHDMDSYPDLPRRKGRGFRSTRNGDGSRGKRRMGKDDLDRELDEMFANRGD